MNTGYDIRYNVLRDATAILSDRWHAARDIEFRKSEFENRVPSLIDPPSSEDIIKLAEQLYSFIKKKD